MNIEEGISKKEEQKIITKETPLTIENRNVKISEFVDARSLEVSEFTNLLKTKLVSHNKLAFQLLPKHMRRRAMSHNRYRTPARIRNKLEEKDIELKKPIRCRKHLRKKKLLLISYMKRSAKAKWLETHIWHAKRMKMMSYFGYKVAQKAHAKSGRAAYSYLSRDCLIYDMSYYIILEIKALKNKIFTIVEEIADSESSEWTQFCNSKQIQGGGRKGELTLFYREKDNPNAPKRMIQKVEYIWKPVKDPDEPTKIWFFLHPSTQDIVQEFINSKAGDKECELKLHQNNFDFFHLLGPTSCSKLYSLIKKLDLTEQSKEQVWNKELLNWMEVIEDPGTYPKGFILHLSLELNPNSKLIQFPKSIPQDQIESNFNNQANFNTYISRLLFYDYGVSPEASELKLWDPPSDIFLPAKDIQTRGRYTHKKKEYLKAQEKNKKKPKNSTNKSEPQNITNENPPEKIIPEEPLTQLPQSEMIPEENKEQKRELIELIVIHDEGEKKTAKGAGLKIIVNGGGGLKIWKILNYLGCKAVGMTEYHQALNERMSRIFPDDFPESIAYEKHAENKKQESIACYFKKPPAKRINYLKIASPFAFGPNWNIFTTEKSLGIHNLIPVIIKMSNRYPIDGAPLFLPLPEDLQNQNVDLHILEPLKHTKLEVPLKKISPSDYLDKLSQINTARKIIGNWFSFPYLLKGFVTTGYYSYRFGCGIGKGYLSRSYLEELDKYKVHLENSDTLRTIFNSNLCYQLLLKNNTSRFYHSCLVYVV